MLYKRTNKAGNLVELLSVGEVSFLRAKLDDRLYKTLLILKSGEIVHVNLTQQELDELVKNVELHMNDYGAKIYRTPTRPLGNGTQVSPEKPEKETKTLVNDVESMIDKALDDLPEPTKDQE